MHIYKSIGEAIRKHVPEITWIALDKGQIDDPENYDSLLCPAVLVRADTDWDHGQGGYQRGTATISVKVCFILPAGTNDIDPFFDLNLTELDIADQVHEAIYQAFKSLRVRSREYMSPDNLYYVVEHTYTHPVAYQPPAKETTPRPDPDIRGTLTINL